MQTVESFYGILSISALVTIFSKFYLQLSLKSSMVR